MTRRPSSYMSPALFLLLAFAAAVSQAQFEALSQEIRVSPGQNVVMTCNASNTDPTTIYQWKKPGDNKPYYGQVLIVSSVSKEDEGVYSCHAITRDASGKTFEDVRSTSLVLKPSGSSHQRKWRSNHQVERQVGRRNWRSTGIQNDDGAPMLSIVPPGKTFTATIPMGITRDCRIERGGDSDDYDIKWFTPTGVETNYGSILYIYVDSRDLQGLYKCEATHKVTGEKLTEYFTLNINPVQGNGQEDVINIGGGAEEEPIIEFNPPPINGILERNVGSQIYQVCSVKNALPTAQDYRFHWIGPDGFRRISESHFFYLSGVTPSDSGEYTCVVTNLVSGVEYRKNLRLIVSGNSNGVDPQNYRVFISSNPAKPIIGNRLELLCETDPRLPGATYQWYVRGIFCREGSQYIIPNVQKTDVLNAKYECRVTINGIQQAVEQTMTVTVHTSRELRLTPPPGPQIVVNLGDRKELHCEVERTGSRYRGRDVQWFYQGLPLIADSSRGIDRLDRVMVSIIVLNSIQQQHEGKYECRLGNIPKEAYIIVMSAEMSSLEVNPPENRVEENEIVEFHCRANSIPNVRNTDLEWYFLGTDRNGPERPLGRQWVISNSANTLETSFIQVDQAKVSDTGYYLCRVSSRMNVPEVEPAVGYLEVRAITVIETITIFPSIVRVQINREGTATCQVNANGRQPSTPNWRFLNGQSISSDPRYELYSTTPGRIEIRFSRLSLRDNGTILECYTVNGREELTIIVDGFSCGPNSFQCDNGNQCFDRSKRCDGKRDCLDGSDENPAYCNACDPLDSRCEVFNGRAPLKATYSPSWQCDGEDDCGNGFDESNCRKFGNVCGGTSFECSDGLSIPRAYMCDKEQDCRNGEDENGCTGPPIIQNYIGNRINRVRVGENVVLTCEAMGKPMPKVIWRFNWRCLPDPSRMTVTNTELNCEKVESKLTIINVRREDEGIYNCEALSANQRSISDDYQVTLYNNQ